MIINIRHAIDCVTGHMHITIWQVNNLKKIHSNCGPIPAEDKGIEELFLALKKKPPSAGVTG